MKRFMMVLLVLASAAVYAQKPVKPNLTKALASLKEGKYEEAKTNVDAAITNEKMKDDGKTWYYRGLVYMAIDTSSSESVRALAPDAFNVAMESFAEADKKPEAKKGYAILDATGVQVKDDQIKWWGASHLNKGAKAYQNEDYAGAMSSFETATKINPEDTLAYFYGGFAAQQAENYEKAEENFRKYIDKGGKSPDAYFSLINMYSGPKENKEKALELVREGKKKFPANTDLPKLEIQLLVDLERVDEAKASLEQAIKTEPNNKILHFYLGYTNAQLKNIEAAKKNYEDALRIDPKYFEAQFFLARLMYMDVVDLKKQMGALGISPADRKKREDLDKILVQKLKIALPYWEKAEQLNGTDQEVLDALYSIYSDLDMQDQSKRVEKKFKELGYEN